MTWRPIDHPSLLALGLLLVLSTAGYGQTIAVTCSPTGVNGPIANTKQITPKGTYTPPYMYVWDHLNWSLMYDLNAGTGNPPNYGYQLPSVTGSGTNAGNNQWGDRAFTVSPASAAANFYAVEATFYARGYFSGTIVSTTAQGQVP